MPSLKSQASEPITPLSPASDDGHGGQDRPSLPRTWTDLEPHTGRSSARSSRARVSFRLSLFKTDCPPSPTTPLTPTTPTRTPSTPSKRLSAVAPALWRKVSAPASPVRAQRTVDPRHARHVLICPVHAVPALLRAPRIDPRDILGRASCEDECACPAFACAVSLSGRRGCAAACPALRLRKVDNDVEDDEDGRNMDDQHDMPRDMRAALKIPRTPLSMETTDVLDVLGHVDDLDVRAYEYGLALPVPTVRIVPLPVDAAAMARVTAEMGKITAQRVVLFTELVKGGAGAAAAQVRVPYELEAESIVVNVAVPKCETEPTTPRFEIDSCDTGGEPHHALHVWAPPLAITSASVFIHIFDPAWRRARVPRTDVPPVAGGILDDIVWNAAHALRDRRFVFVGIDALPAKVLRRHRRRHTNAADSPISAISATSSISATTAITPAQALHPTTPPTPTTPGFPAPTTNTTPPTPTTPHLPDAAAHPNARTLLAAIFDLTVRVLRDAPHVPGKIHPRAVWTDERIAALVAKRVTFYTIDEYRAAVGETTWRVHTVGYPWHQPQGGGV